MNTDTILLNTCFFGPIEYYAHIISHDKIIIEQYEHYSKQTYRNRCNILGANGSLSLSYPVVKASSKKILTKDVLISYESKWQKLHFKSIESAYKSSPFYDYYIDDLMQFFDKKWSNLLEYNTAIQEEIFTMLEIEPNISFSQDFHPKGTTKLIDLRDAVHPKENKSIVNTNYKQEKYTQVFSNKFPFQGNLSILDLIFNLGPDALTHLEASIKK